MRLLLNPAPVEGGAIPAPVVPVVPAAVAPAAPAPATPPPPDPSKFTPDMLRELLAARDQLHQIQTESAKALEAERQKAIQALADKGQIQTAFEELRKDHSDQLRREREKVAQQESQLLTISLDNEAARGLSAATFADADAASAARELVSRRLESVRDPNTGQVVTRDKVTGQPAAEFIKAWLSGPVAARLLAPTSKGGVPFGGNAPVTTPDPNAAPLSGEAAVIEAWRQRQQAINTGPTWQRPRARPSVNRN